MPPECPVCETGPAGAAPRPAQASPRESALNWTRWPKRNAAFGGGEKKLWITLHSRRYRDATRQRPLANKGGADGGDKFDLTCTT